MCCKTIVYIITLKSINQNTHENYQIEQKYKILVKALEASSNHHHERWLLCK